MRKENDPSKLYRIKVECNRYPILKLHLNDRVFSGLMYTRILIVFRVYA